MFAKSTTLVAAILLAPALASAQTTTPDATVQVPTIDSVITDMTSASEALVIDPRYDFQHRAVVIQYAPHRSALPTWWPGSRPEWCYNSLSWFTAWEAQGNAASNTRVQLRNLRMHVLSEKTRTWRTIDISHAPYTGFWKYPFTSVGNDQLAGTRAEATGGLSMKPVYPNFHHGYGKPVAIVDPADVRAVYVAMEFRLVVENPALPDDRAKARYVVNAGADFYPGAGTSWGVDWAPGIGGSRYQLATTTWRTTSMLVPNKMLGATYTEMKTNAPPLVLAVN